MMVILFILQWVEQLVESGRVTQLWFAVTFAKVTERTIYKFWIQITKQIQYGFQLIETQMP